MYSRGTRRLKSWVLSLAVWRIHRRIGMSGGLLVQALSREIGQRLTSEQAQELQKRHAAAYERYQSAIQPETRQNSIRVRNGGDTRVRRYFCKHFSTARWALGKCREQ